ncbi:superoxide dismutase family protein [Endozoicomonas sp. GU-1]|uniref:superoxide dismutase family protein n=1 Tax=Endozoicomonas sp. GU-1 TaxID=3009078 RepID=UPI0022B3F591|nr:superoxide dismutase family protein [Endozoicomonas sp. GU-1]WBA82689.1 superoxide dismutase family protein [Endozoicomonas sp. GU-1]
MVNKGIRFLALPIALSALLSGCSNNTGQVEGKVEEKLEVVMFRVTPAGNGPTIGSVIIHHADDVTKGVRLQPTLHDLSPGKHGFHVHENPSCEPGERGGRALLPWPQVITMTPMAPATTRGLTVTGIWGICRY